MFTVSITALVISGLVIISVIWFLIQRGKRQTEAAYMKGRGDGWRGCENLVIGKAEKAGLRDEVIELLR